MSASVHTSFLIDADNMHKSRAQIHRGEIIAAVYIDADSRTAIQGAPAALRVLAAALVEAADKGDTLLAEARAAVSA